MSVLPCHQASCRWLHCRGSDHTLRSCVLNADGTTVRRSQPNEGTRRTLINLRCPKCRVAARKQLRHSADLFGFVGWNRCADLVCKAEINETPNDPRFNGPGDHARSFRSLEVQAAARGERAHRPCCQRHSEDLRLRGVGLPQADPVEHHDRHVVDSNIGLRVPAVDRELAGDQRGPRTVSTPPHPILAKIAWNSTLSRVVSMPVR